MPLPENNILFYWTAPECVPFFAMQRDWREISEELRYHAPDRNAVLIGTIVIIMRHGTVEEDAVAWIAEVAADACNIREVKKNHA